MKKRTNKKITTVLMMVGILLMLGAVGLMMRFYSLQGSSSEKAEQIVSKLYALIPEVQNSVPDDRSDVTMPMLEVDGVDFVGIIEIPIYESKLPIYATWDKTKVSQYPCRYTGSMYDGSLVIGGSDNEGQFDFMKIITGGDYVYVTDVTGARFPYVVTDIQKSKDVSTENLTSAEADLVLYARNTYAFDYTIVSCMLEMNQ